MSPFYSPFILFKITWDFFANTPYSTSYHLLFFINYSYLLLLRLTNYLLVFYVKGRKQGGREYISPLTEHQYMQPFLIIILPLFSLHYQMWHWFYISLFFLVRVYFIMNYLNFLLLVGWFSCLMAYQSSWVIKC